MIMSIMAESKGGDFVEAPLGSHGARCWQILDLGHQKNEFNGEVSVKHQVLVSWELPNLDRLEDGRAVSISKFYTLSLHEKANLGIDLVSWRGKSFTEDEKQGFDITALMGVPCMLSIVDKNNKSRVGGVMGLPKGMELPEAVNIPVIFEMEAYINGDTKVFDSLSEGLQKLIKKAEEFKPESLEAKMAAPVEDGFDDDIPFR